MNFEDLHVGMQVRIIDFEDDSNERPEHWDSEMDVWQSEVVTINYLEKGERVYLEEDEGEWQWYPWDFISYCDLNFNDPNLVFKRHQKALFMKEINRRWEENRKKKKEGKWVWQNYPTLDKGQ